MKVFKIKTYLKKTFLQHTTNLLTKEVILILMMSLVFIYHSTQAKDSLKYS